MKSIKLKLISNLESVSEEVTDQQVHYQSACKLFWAMLSQYVESTISLKRIFNTCLRLLINKLLVNMFNID